jgi:hypothetical protein
MGAMFANLSGRDGQDRPHAVGMANRWTPRDDEKVLREKVANLLGSDPQILALESMADKGEVGQRNWTQLWSKRDQFWYYNDKLYVPPGARVSVLRMTHDDPLAGHFGIARTLKRV